MYLQPTYLKGNIDHAIKNRINKLYKILCLRWQSDEKTWLSHIAWLHQVQLYTFLLHFLS